MVVVTINILVRHPPSNVELQLVKRSVSSPPGGPVGFVVARRRRRKIKFFLPDPLDLRTICLCGLAYTPEIHKIYDPKNEPVSFCHPKAQS
jgi:hypothetical protein